MERQGRRRDSPARGLPPGQNIERAAGSPHQSDDAHLPTVSGRDGPTQRRHTEPGLARHQGVGEHLRLFPEGQRVGRTSLPTFPARHRLGGRTQHPAPRRAAFPHGRHHAVGEAAHRLHEAESPTEAVGEGAGEHRGAGEGTLHLMAGGPPPRPHKR